MGYACPVCDAEQPDGEHLANHVAFTAMARGGDHETWLDDAVPDWPERNPDTLGPELVPHATEIETAVTTDDGAHPRGFEGELSDHGGYGRDAISEDDRAVLDEAVALTRRMYGLDEDAGEPDAGDDGSRGNSENE